jgi:glycosyltransferase involved in cell wall biosynthesis
MKILFWTDGFWPRIGGAETYAFQFVQGMQARGHECLVLAQKDHPDWKNEEVHQGAQIKRADFDLLLTHKNIRPIHHFLERVAKNFQPDLIFLNTLARGSAFAFLLFRKMFNARVIARVHSPYWDVAPPLVEKLCLSIDRLACVSQWSLNVMHSFFPSIKDKLQLVYNGLPLPSLKPAPLPFSPPVFLLLGRLSLEKGFDTAIHAFSLLKQPAKLLIAGSGPERPFLEHLVDQLGIRHSTQFIGEISSADSFSAINQATALLMPSHFEAFGFGALEAMLMERPVIASNVGGLQEIIAHEETGFFTSPKEPLLWLQQMEKLLQSPVRAVQMGIEGKKRALAHFSLEKNLDQYEELIRVI